MLAARFIAYGIAFMYIATDVVKHRLWLKVMVLIQAIDLLAGLVYTLSGVVNFALSALPMFNALWIVILLVLWMPRKQPA